MMLCSLPEPYKTYLLRLSDADIVTYVLKQVGCLGASLEPEAGAAEFGVWGVCRALSSVMRFAGSKFRA